jgi:sulfur carrier protein ThiS adenylyltransferase
VSVELSVIANPTISIRLNERSIELPKGISLQSLRRERAPDSDIAILNGFPATDDVILAEDDEVIFIQRGVAPEPEELEDLLVARHGPLLHEKLKRGQVGIAGCGGLGSTVAVALARSGVGRLVLVDFDVVEPSNLNRQQYFVDQIGLPKVEALAANLARINPYVACVRHQLRLRPTDVTRVLAGCDVVAECFDSPAAKADLAMAMRKHLPAVPLVAVSGLAGYGPASDIVSRRVLGNHFLVGDGVSAAQPGRGLLAPRVTVAAGHQANIVLRLLLGAISPHEGG